MRFPSLRVFRECPDQRFFPIERGPDFEKMVELKVVRDIWVLGKNTALLQGCCTIRIEAASMPARSSEDCWPRTKQEPR